jgi:hypothetical protein
MQTMRYAGLVRRLHQALQDDPVALARLISADDHRDFISAVAESWAKCVAGIGIAVEDGPVYQTLLEAAEKREAVLRDFARYLDERHTRAVLRDVADTPEHLRRARSEICDLETPGDEDRYGPSTTGEDVDAGLRAAWRTP